MTKRNILAAIAFLALAAAAEAGTASRAGSSFRTMDEVVSGSHRAETVPPVLGWIHDILTGTQSVSPSTGTARSGRAACPEADGCIGEEVPGTAVGDANADLAD